MIDSPGTVVVVLGGGDVDTEACLAALARSKPPHLVIAADSGLAQGNRLGLAVDLVIGDLDSVPARDLAEAEAQGVLVERHPETKDKTDLELALDRAVGMAPESVLVLGTAGGRLDHALSILTVLCADAFGGVAVEAVVDRNRVRVLRGPGAHHLDAPVGSLLTLLAVGGPAEVESTSGLAYALRGETLSPTSSRGVSNVHTETIASISLSRGVLLAVHPSPSGRRDRHLRNLR